MLGESDDPLRIFASTQDGVWAVNMQQRIVSWNAAAEKLLGFRAEDALGRRCYRLLAGRHTQGSPDCFHACPLLDRAREGEPLANADRLVRCLDGRTLLINVSALFIPEGGATGSAEPGYLVHLFRAVEEGPELTEGLRIHLLGGTTVARADACPLQGPLWQRAKVRALFGILAVRQGHWVSRHFLIETLWPDLAYTAACHNLNTTVYNLRRSLEPELSRGAESQYVHYKHDHYRLYGDPAHWLDVEAFETGLQRARRATCSHEAVSLCRQALDYYRGDFQEDLGLESAWHQAKRTHLRRRYLHSLEKLGRLYESLQRDTEAMASYIEALKLDPCFESACRCLMRLLLKEGDHLAAAIHYRRLVEALQDELDIRPSKKTQQLYKSALSNG